MIDLGLPSGTKWACCNVGSSEPEGNGGYYSWGETEEKSIYNQVTYLYCSGIDEDRNGYYEYDEETGSKGNYHNIGRNVYQYHITDLDGDGFMDCYIGTDFFGIDEDGDGKFDDYSGKDINKYISNIEENESNEDVVKWCLFKNDIAGTKYDVAYVK